MRVDKIWRALERLSGKHINAVHGESSKYAFRTLDGCWHTVRFEFANELAGLGYINCDLFN